MSSYTTKGLDANLGKILCKSLLEVHARVQMVLPQGRNPLQREFNIKEIKLVENQIIGAKEKYRMLILVE